ncbi:MAG: AAA family ATPase [Planctomycetota bacterium]
MADRIVPTRKVLVLVMGVAGSGKSTLAKALLERMVCVYLDNNFIADAFYANTRTDPQYVRLRPHLYSALYRIAEENLAVGNSVLLDVPHVKDVQDPKWCDFIQGLADGRRARLIVLRSFCSEDCLRKRLSERKEERDAWKFDNWEEFCRREPIDVTIPFEHMDIDMELPLQIAVERAWNYVLDRIR